MDNNVKKPKNWLRNVVLVVGFIFLFIYNFLLAPYGNKDTVIHISDGASIDSVVLKLKSERTVRSGIILEGFVRLLKSGRGIISGDYLIKKNSPVWVVAWQIGRGHHNIEPVKVTIREGLTNKEISNLLADKLAGFRKDLFLAGTNNKQGYLFPDTYFFFPLDTASEIIQTISNNFDSKIKNIKDGLMESNKSLSEIITMASILEGEASGKSDIGIISGILWKRIEKGIPLQVDIARETYKEKGLPANPINNPGIQSINAALNPVDSLYLYYLHDADGNVHYAKTYEEHKSNIKKYLKNY